MNIYKWISALNVGIAKIASWFAFLLMLIVSYDVIMRYLFNAPTMWAFDLSWMLYSAHFMLGLAYVSCLNGHVRVDVLYDRFSFRRRKILDMCFFFLFILPFGAVIIIFAIPNVIISWTMREGSNFTLWAPAIYPVKTLIPIAFFLFTVQEGLQLIKKYKSNKL